MLDEISGRCNTLEECYEFMLAYAAQGLPSDQGSAPGAQIRECLGRAAEAVAGLARSCETAVEKERLEPAARYRDFLEVVRRDAADSLAAIELALAQPAISSQLIDNLNASIHLRALLTDLFLLSEIAKPQHASAKPATSC